MNLRLEAILKKEKNLYKDITGNLKGKNFVELNGGLAETIAMLLERKELIEQLNQGVLADDVREELYERIENNNKYFAGVDRVDISNQFMRADDSYAKSAEWQNLHMAFLSTASVSSYKAVDKFNNNFEDLKKRKEKIDEALERTNESKKYAMETDPYTTVANAKEQWEKYKAEKDKLYKAFEKKQDELDKIKLEYQPATKTYNSSKTTYDNRMIARESLPKLSEDMKKDPECIKYLPPEHFDKLINEQKDVLKKNEEARAAAIANASAEYKSYFEATYTKEEAEKLAFLDGFKKHLDIIASDNGDAMKEAYGMYMTNAYKSNLLGIVREFERYSDPAYPNHKKTLAAETELRAMIDAFDKLHRELYPEHYEVDPNELITVNLFKAAEASEVIGKMIKQINNQLDRRKEEIFNTLSEKEKDLISPSEETKKSEKNIKDKIAKLEAAKNEAIEARKSEAEFNREFNTFINRKIKAGGYKIPQIPPIKMEKVKGDEWIKETIESDLKKNKGLMDKNKEINDKVEKAIEDFAPIKNEYDKNVADLNKKINHAKQMMKPEQYFYFDEHEKALNTHCKDVPKLDVKAVMEAKRVAGNDLLQMVNEYKGNHKNSPEFDAMVGSMLYVTNWGTDFTMPTTYSNAPKTFEEAIEQLKENCKKYVDAKNDQKRPFPSKMRHLRFQIAKAFDMYADTQKESLKDFKTSEKVANSWNEYFASRGEKEILNEQNIDIATGISQQNNEPVLENEEDGMEM